MHLPERDGIVADLFFLDLMLKMRKKPSELVAELMEIAGPSSYLRRDVHFDAATYPREKERIMRELSSARPDTLDGSHVARAVMLDTQDGAKFFREDGSWLLIRLSGTEPLVRIYAETRSDKELAPLLDAGERLIGITH
jgi:phosphomannomutase